MTDAPWSADAGSRQTSREHRRTNMRAVVGRAGILRVLHQPGNPLVLPNVWDAASARLVEAAGFAAVATSSAAIAKVLGYADGEATPADEMFAAIGRIVAAVSIPVSADVERGYGLGPALLVERLIAAGVAGCNLEDSDPATGALIDPGRQADFLAAVRGAAVHAGVDLVINARIDTFLRGAGSPAEQLSEAIQRARRYRDAGADCVYPIFATGAEAIQALVRRCGSPVNIMFRAGTPAASDLAGLAALGVARISFGSGLHQAVQGCLARMLTEIAAGGDPYSGDRSPE